MICFASPVDYVVLLQTGFKQSDYEYDVASGAMKAMTYESFLITFQC